MLRRHGYAARVCPRRQQERATRAELTKASGAPPPWRPAGRRRERPREKCLGLNPLPRGLRAEAKVAAGHPRGRCTEGAAKAVPARPRRGVTVTTLAEPTGAGCAPASGVPRRRDRRIYQREGSALWQDSVSAWITHPPFEARVEPPILCRALPLPSPDSCKPRSRRGPARSLEPGSSGNFVTQHWCPRLGCERGKESRKAALHLGVVLPRPAAKFTGARLGRHIQQSAAKIGPVATRRPHVVESRGRRIKVASRLAGRLLPAAFPSNSRASAAKSGRTRPKSGQCLPKRGRCGPKLVGIDPSRANKRPSIR